MKNVESINILYIDDEPHNLVAFKATFRKDFNIFTAETPSIGKQILADNKIHILIVDQRMPEMTGTEFLASILETYPEPIRILLTGYSDINAVIDAINKGQVYRYLSKPWDENDIRLVINNAYELFTLKAENKQLLKTLQEVNQQLEFMIRQKLLS